MIRRVLRLVALPFVVLALLACTLPASAQLYLVKHDVAVDATGQFTPSLTSQSNVPHQATTDSFGGLVTYRDRFKSWAGIELNYQFTPFSERFSNNSGQSLANVPLAFHEFSAAYLVHARFGRVLPYVSAGGASLLFKPSNSKYISQFRGAGLFEMGADIPSVRNPRFGMRLGARMLMYRAPNFYNSSIASSRWVGTVEPNAGVYAIF